METIITKRYVLESPLKLKEFIKRVEAAIGEDNTKAVLTILSDMEKSTCIVREEETDTKATLCAAHGKDCLSQSISNANHCLKAATATCAYAERYCIRLNMHVLERVSCLNSCEYKKTCFK